MSGPLPEDDEGSGPEPPAKAGDSAQAPRVRKLIYGIRNSAVNLWNWCARLPRDFRPSPRLLLLILLTAAFVAGIAVAATDAFGIHRVWYASFLLANSSILSFVVWLDVHHKLGRKIWEILATGLLVAMLVNVIHATIFQPWIDSSPPSASEYFRNEDLTRVTGEAIQFVLKVVQEDVRDSHDQNIVRTYAAGISSHWMELMGRRIRPRYADDLREDMLIHFQRDPERLALTAACWESILSPIHPVSDLHERGSWDTVVRALQTRFGHALLQGIKRDPKAETALHWLTAGESLRLQADLASEVELLARTSMEALGRPINRSADGSHEQPFRNRPDVMGLSSDELLGTIRAMAALRRDHNLVAAIDTAPPARIAVLVSQHRETVLERFQRTSDTSDYRGLSKDPSELALDRQAMIAEATVCAYYLAWDALQRRDVDTAQSLCNSVLEQTPRDGLALLLSTVAVAVSHAGEGAMALQPILAFMDNPDIAVNWRIAAGLVLVAAQTSPKQDPQVTDAMHRLVDLLPAASQMAMFARVELAERCDSDAATIDMWEQFLQQSADTLKSRPMWATFARGRLADVLLKCERPDRARHVLEESLRIAQASGNAEIEAGVWQGLAKAFVAANELDQAQAAGLHALAILRSFGSKHSVCNQLEFLAEVQESAGDSQAALHSTQEQAALIETLGFQSAGPHIYSLRWPSENLVRLYVKTNQPDLAEEALGRAVEIAAAHGDSFDIRWSFRQQEEFLTSRGRWKQAAAALRRRVASRESLDPDQDHYSDADIQNRVIQYLALAGDVAGAIDARREQIRDPSYAGYQSRVENLLEYASDELGMGAAVGLIPRIRRDVARTRDHVPAWFFEEVATFYSKRGETAKCSEYRAVANLVRHREWTTESPPPTSAPALRWDQVDAAIAQGDLGAAQRLMASGLREGSQDRSWWWAKSRLETLVQTMNEQGRVDEILNVFLEVELQLHSDRALRWIASVSLRLARTGGESSRADLATRISLLSAARGALLKLGDSAQAAQVQFELAKVCEDAGNHSDARAAMNFAMKLGVPWSSPSEHAEVLAFQATVAKKLNEWPRAAKLLEERCDVMETYASKSDVAAALDDWGIMCIGAGWLDTATGAMQKSLDMRAWLQMDATVAQMAVALIDERRGQLESALRRYETLLRETRNTELEQTEGYIRLRLAGVLRRLGRVQDATTMNSQAAAVFDRLGELPLVFHELHPEAFSQ